jgi:hypothetical protein
MATTATPSTIHSHGYGTPDPVVAGVCEGVAETSELGAGEVAGGGTTAGADVGAGVVAGGTATAGGDAVASGEAGAVVGSGVFVLGEKVGSEIVLDGAAGGEMLRFRLGVTVGKVLLPCAQPAARHPAARIVTARASLTVSWLIPALL